MKEKQILYKLGFNLHNSNHKVDKKLYYSEMLNNYYKYMFSFVFRTY